MYRPFLFRSVLLPPLLSFPSPLTNQPNSAFSLSAFEFAAYIPGGISYSILFLPFSFLSFPFLSFPILYTTFPFLSFPFLSFPFPFPFLTLPYRFSYTIKN